MRPFLFTALIALVPVIAAEPASAQRWTPLTGVLAPEGEDRQKAIAESCDAGDGEGRQREL